MIGKLAPCPLPSSGVLSEIVTSPQSRCKINKHDAENAGRVCRNKDLILNNGHFSVTTRHVWCVRRRLDRPEQSAFDHRGSDATPVHITYLDEVDNYSSASFSLLDDSIV